MRKEIENGLALTILVVGALMTASIVLAPWGIPVALMGWVICDYLDVFKLKG